jgi:hypothetical protein
MIENDKIIECVYKRPAIFFEILLLKGYIKAKKKKCKTNSKMPLNKAV